MTVPDHGATTTVDAEGGGAVLEVSTRLGVVRGKRTAEGRVFLDVPYAAPPVGSLRFAAPAAHPAWSGVRDATRPGPTAPQPARGRMGVLELSPFFSPGWVRGDDYLTVNIWAPAEVAPAAPVVVFVHGGAFLAGSNRAPAYDGSAFARDGVVFVGVNYRLGAAGFLHLPDAPGNRGLLDVAACLQWVQDNIADFGGDPSAVTLAGQSAGGILVGAVLASGHAHGTFRSAIIESGSGTAAFTPAQATIVTTALCHALAIEASATAFADVDDERLVEALPALSQVRIEAGGGFDPLGGITPFSLVLDQQPADGIAHGSGGGITLLIGSNSDESSLYVTPFGPRAPLDDHALLATAARFHPDPEQLVAAYRQARPDESLDRLNVAILSDGMFGAGVRAAADGHAASGTAATYLYEFTWASNALEGHLGACHLMELPFVFDHVDLPELLGPSALLGTEEVPSDLATRMHTVWIDFIRTGNPGWPRYTPDAPTVQLIGTAWRQVLAPHPDEYRTWNAHRPTGRREPGTD